MFIKNTLRLLLSNLKLCFKTMLFRFILTVAYFWAFWLIANVGFRNIFLSREFGNLLDMVKQLWMNFFKMDFEASVDFVSAGQGVIQVIKDNALQASVVSCLLFVLTYLFFVLSGLCSYTSSVMVHKHMSALQKTHFLATMFECFTKAVGFECFYAILKLLVYIVSVVILFLIVYTTGPVIGMLSVPLALWFVLFLLCLFYALTAKLRPGMTVGLSFRQMLKDDGYKRSMFIETVAAYFFSVVLALYFNVTVFFATLGAGIFVSIPVTYMYFVVLQLVVVYTIDSKRYFIDYDRIITPREMRSDEERLLNEVDI
ncbi:MAG: hypothetical protein ACI4M6_01230 [Christensenellaceae bacterium]